MEYQSYKQGPIVLAIGAGVGEEAFFRGWLQQTLVDQLANSYPELSVVGGIFAASVLFGLGHAATPTYFLWATVFGGVMGIEYIKIGLPATAFTHAFYDWITFVTIKELWKPITKQDDDSQSMSLDL